MLRIDFYSYIKPLLRACGLNLLALFLITTAFTVLPLSAFSVPSVAIQRISQLLESSALLVLALLMLLISLADRSRARAMKPGDKPLGLRDTLIIRARFLVGLAAILYILMIPYTFVQAQLVRTIGIRLLDGQIKDVTTRLESLRASARKPSLSEADVAALKRTYPDLPLSNDKTITTQAKLRSAIDKSFKDVKTGTNTRRTKADQVMARENLRLTLFCLVYAGLLGYFWFYWPRYSALVPKPTVSLEAVGLVEEGNKLGY